MGKSKAKLGRPEAYPGEGRAVRLSFSTSAAVADRLETAVKQTGASRSAIVDAAVRQILARSPDRLANAVAASSKRPAADRLSGGAAD